MNTIIYLASNKKYDMIEDANELRFASLSKRKDEYFMRRIIRKYVTAIGLYFSPVHPSSVSLLLSFLLSFSS
jgi:hypothetical protein